MTHTYCNTSNTCYVFKKCTKSRQHYHSNIAAITLPFPKFLHSGTVAVGLLFLSSSACAFFWLKIRNTVEEFDEREQLAAASSSNSNSFSSAFST